MAADAQTNASDTGSLRSVGSVRQSFVLGELATNLGAILAAALLVGAGNGQAVPLAAMQARQKESLVQMRLYYELRNILGTLAFVYVLLPTFLDTTYPLRYFIPS